MGGEGADERDGEETILIELKVRLSKCRAPIEVLEAHPVISELSD